ncbi:hypothetical protein Tco_0692999 [Tanacetum coccineum]
MEHLIPIPLIAWIEKLLKDRLPLRKLRKPFGIVENVVNAPGPDVLDLVINGALGLKLVSILRAASFFLMVNVFMEAFPWTESLIRLISLRVVEYGYFRAISVLLAMPMLNLLIMFSSNVTLLQICRSSFLDGVIFLFFKLLLGILSMIRSSFGMLLKRKNTGSMLLLLRFFGGFGDTEIASRLTLQTLLRKVI